MKKVIIAAICGLCLFAGATVLFNDSTVQIAGSAGDIHVRI